MRRLHARCTTASWETALNRKHTNCSPKNFITTISTLAVLVLAAVPAAGQSWTITASGGKSITNWHGQAATQTLSVEWNGWTWRGIEVGVGATPYFVRQPKSWFSDDYGDGNETIIGPRIHAVARKTFRMGSLLRPYAELAGGPLWTPKQVPDSTSQLNWVTDIGGGFEIAPGAARSSLIVGYRFSHISNGGLSSRNPGWNVSSVVVGVRVR